MNTKIKNQIALFCFVFLLSFSQKIATAHTLSYGAIKTNLNVSGTEIFLHTVVPQSISYISPYEKKSQKELFGRQISNLFVIKQDEQICPFSITSLKNDNPDQSIVDGRFDCSKSINGMDSLKIHVAIFSEDFTSYDHFVNFSTPTGRWELVFDKANQDYPQNVSATLMGSIITRFIAVSKQFTWLGLIHIWTGYDHILFLLLIIIMVRSLKKILILVTSFTIAHSITLIFASFNIIKIPSGVVEPLIALTIIYIAGRNLYLLYVKNKKHTIYERWFTTFGFGLVHGLGFASALMATDIPKDFFVPSLIIFNVGIEIGQILILILTVPILMLIDKSAHKSNILKFISLIGGLLAVLWFFERIFT